MKETPIFEEVFPRIMQLPGFWVKVLIGGLLSFIPIVNVFAFGYLLRLSRRFRKSGEVAMPEWGDWQGLFIDGLKFAVVWLAYWLLPLLLALAISSVVGMAGLGAISYLLLSISFVLSPVLFSAALYRYNMRSDFKDLLDIGLIIRMTSGHFPRMLVPALCFTGIFALAAPLYGFAIFFGFVILIAYSSLSYRVIEKRQAAAVYN